ncbi:hypothetical protein [Peribacillus tepidiphilus]|uniref:hypothetical protein n=1 Tax=Peribacillus tepidiphilus TaxID=2652445 RepID=UPI001292684E|nr:hypothetical protein [Peribacillus tepidiphilus]
MNVTIELHLYARGTRWMQRGSFPVKVSDFKKDPDFAAAVVAYEWIRQIKMEMGLDAEVEKVIYDGEHDITEIVKQIRPVIDDLPF